MCVLLEYLLRIVAKVVQYANNAKYCIRAKIANPLSKLVSRIVAKYFMQL